jgi:tripartite-type tricarboxylate transporter receptor subunit TctC
VGLARPDLIVVFVLAALTFSAAHSQDYPSRQVTFVVPYAPGGAIDLTARLFAQKLTERLGKPFIVENRAGSGTVIGTNMVAKSAPDGHTILAVPSPIAINATLYKKLPYDPAKDFAAIARVSDAPFVLVVNPSLPVHTVMELIKYGKERPGRLSYASSGVGSTLHLAGELFKSMTDIDMAHVPYRGGPLAMNDVVAGHVQLVFADPASAVVQLKANTVRALGVSSLTRLPAAPELAPIAELGVPGFEAVSWVLFVAPVATPTAILEKLNMEIKALAALPDVQQQILAMGQLPVNSPGVAALRSFIPSEVARWGKLVEQAGIAGSE